MRAAGPSSTGPMPSRPRRASCATLKSLRASTPRRSGRRWRAPVGAGRATSVLRSAAIRCRLAMVYTKQISSSRRIRQLSLRRSRRGDPADILRVHTTWCFALLAFCGSVNDVLAGTAHGSVAPQSCCIEGIQWQRAKARLHRADGQVRQRRRTHCSLWFLGGVLILQIPRARHTHNRNLFSVYPNFRCGRFGTTLMRSASPIWDR